MPSNSKTQNYFNDSAASEMYQRKIINDQQIVMVSSWANQFRVKIKAICDNFTAKLLNIPKKSCYMTNRYEYQ